MHPKLAWVGLLKNTISTILDTPINISYIDPVDPLKKIVVFDFVNEFSKNNYNPFQRIAHAYAKVNDCVIATIKIDDCKLIIEILIKNRLSERMGNDPFMGDKNSIKWSG